jgi:hypothetical protein
VFERVVHAVERAPQLFDAVALPVRQDLADDPFVGRAGRRMAMGQHEQQLNLEFLVPISVTTMQPPTAR